MTAAPAPRVPQARMNAGAYPVRVAVALQKLTGTADGLTAPVSERVTVQTGTAYADRLDLPRERWAVRHYRRAVMAGAGVYAAGLWARLQPGRSAQVLDLDTSAVPMNDVGTLARFLPPAPPVITVDLQAGGGLTMRQIEKAPKHMREGLEAHFSAALQRGLEALWEHFSVTTRTGFRYKELLAKLTGQPSTAPRHAVGHWHISGAVSAYEAYVTAALQPVLGPDLTRKERRHLQRIIRRVLLALLKRAPRPPVRRQPPPLYCLPRPPAAPQAPPALQ